MSKLLNKGFLKVRVNGEIRDLEYSMKVDRYKTHDIEIVIDRMAIDNEEDTDKRLSSIKTAMYHGEDVMMFENKEEAKSTFYSRNLMCPSSGISYPQIQTIMVFIQLSKGGLSVL